VAGALHEDDYRRLLTDAGFESVDVEPWRVYQMDDAKQFLAETGLDVNEVAAQVEGKIASAFVRATKPVAVGKAAAACCGPTCCA
jgi:hypothetical protein